MKNRSWEVSIFFAIISVMFITWYLQKKYMQKCKSQRIRKIAHTTISSFEHSISELKKSINITPTSQMETEIHNAVDSLKKSLDQLSSNFKTKKM